jgi:3-hydroxyisobutyrate dehydrogenase-like beta-hydroxyacid dehydrogenase
MSEVTVIGLGAMGSAIAGAFLNAGRAITVWNRSEDKMLALRQDGAHCADSPGTAVSASKVVIVCIDDYGATRELLANHGLLDLLGERVLIQFSTGTPEDARSLQADIARSGAHYLDGAILAYPREIGHDALIAVSGDGETYRNAESLLAALSSDLRYLGSSVGAAAALDIAVMSYYVVTHLGLVHAGLVCESEGVGRDMLAAVLVDSLPSDAEEIAHLGDALQRNAFSDPGASIDVYSQILDRILSQAADRGIDDRIPGFANRLYKSGVDAGLGDQEVVALIKLLRR